MRNFDTLNELEGFARRFKQLRSLQLLHRIRPCKIRLFVNNEDDVITNVYGIESGLNLDESNFIELDVLMDTDAWSPAGFYSAGAMDSAFMFTEDADIKIDSVFRVIREVNGVMERSRMYQVVEKDTFGITSTVAQRFRIKPLGE